MLNFKKILGAVTILGIAVPSSLAVVACNTSENPIVNDKIFKYFNNHNHELNPIKVNMQFLSSIPHSKLTNETLKQAKRDLEMYDLNWDDFLVNTVEWKFISIKDIFLKWVDILIVKTSIEFKNGWITETYINFYLWK